jgi:hypothetical protein
VGPVENFIKMGGEGKGKRRGGEGPRNLSGLGHPNTLIRPCIFLSMSSLIRECDDSWSCRMQINR